MGALVDYDSEMDAKAYCYEFPRPMVTVDAIVIAGEAGKRCILLVQRKHAPCVGAWALPGGFIEMAERLEDAAARELEEETGVRGLPLRQFKAYGEPARDPRGRTISIAFLACVPKALEAEAADDAAAVQWWPLGALPELAFDHAQIIEDAVRHLEGSR